MSEAADVFINGAFIGAILSGVGWLIKKNYDKKKEANARVEANARAEAALLAFLAKDNLRFLKETSQPKEETSQPEEELHN